jgi:hypothetical protein
MSDHLAEQRPSTRRQLAPEVSPLESRALMSSVKLPPGGITFPRLPRTGGIFIQNGAALGIGVGQRHGNTVQISDDGAGDIQADWNGGPVHSFNGISTVIVRAERATNNLITIQRTSPAIGFSAAKLGSAKAAAVTAVEHALKLRGAFRTSGIAMQSGTVLAVVVNRPGANTVEVNNEGGGNVSVEWNGRPAHFFNGVETIVIDTLNGTLNQITLTDQAP